MLGAARISDKALFLPVADTPGTSLTAIAARDQDRARTQAEAFGIDHVLDSYAEVIESDSVDAIYNPLPISLHHEWTIAALRAGKHVLCEKPFASNATEAAEMVAVGKETGLVLMEAYHWRYHPLASRIRALLDDGIIGQIERIDAGFNVEVPPDNEVRHAWELSGGALMDLGCYPLQWARFAAGSEPTVVAASMEEGRPHVDVDTTIDMTFKGGITARVATSMKPGVERAAWLTVSGSDGEMQVTNPIAPHLGNRIVVTSTDTGAQPVVDEEIGGDTTYHCQLVAFRDAVLNDGPIATGGVDAVATMTAIDASYVAAGLPIRGTEL